MSKQKLRVGILFGGKSAEHAVSVQSAKNVFNSLNKHKYDVTLIGIDITGKWYLYSEKKLLESSFANNSSLKQSGQEISLLNTPLDVVFPVLHGPYGEDGSMQGLFKVLGIPFVGPSVLGSAVGMDKDVSKRLLRESGIPVADFLVIRRGEKLQYDVIVKKLGLPFFVKPANLGSSVGISKISSKEQFENSVDAAYDFDNKIIIEKYIKGREIECSVLGNDDPQASVPGEVIPTRDFYDYTAKYLDETGAELKIPAVLNKDVVKKIQALAIKTFKVLCLEGMARVDMFLTKEGKIYINEVNTIPGFTNISMYPKLWEASGLNYSDLLDRLITLAIERFERERKLKDHI